MDGSIAAAVPATSPLALELEAVAVNVDDVLARFKPKGEAVVVEDSNPKPADVVVGLGKVPNPVKPANLPPDAGADVPPGLTDAVEPKLGEDPEPNMSEEEPNTEVGLVSGFVEPVSARGTEVEDLESGCLGSRLGVDEARLESFEVSCCFVPKIEKVDVVSTGLEPVVVLTELETREIGPSDWFDST